MKKYVISIVFALSCFFLSSCGTMHAGEDTEESLETEAFSDTEPQLSQMKTICDLAVMDCYYHNVAKYYEEDASGVLLWKKDKHFWVEYTGKVTIGIDASLLSMSLEGDQITISLPEAKILRSSVDQESLNESSYIVDEKSAKIKAEDEVRAFSEAEQNMQDAAYADKTLMEEARQRVKTLLEDYINNLGNAIGKTYSINWIYVDADGNPSSNVTQDIVSETETESESESVQ